MFAHVGCHNKASLCSLVLIRLKPSISSKSALPFFPTVANPSYLYCRAKIVVHPILVNIVIVRKLYWPSFYLHVLPHLAAANIELFFQGALKMFPHFIIFLFLNLLWPVLTNQPETTNSKVYLTLIGNITLHADLNPFVTVPMCSFALLC